jgi:hypothetical protein
MGVFNNNLIDIAIERIVRASLLLGVTVTLVCGVSSFAADGEARVAPIDRSVSTSPIEGTVPGSLESASPRNPANEAPPLTRAATQRRIEEMSPARWLARYGHVSIDQRD